VSFSIFHKFHSRDSPSHRFCRQVSTYAGHDDRRHDSYTREIDGTLSNNG